MKRIKSYFLITCILVLFLMPFYNISQIKNPMLLDDSKNKIITKTDAPISINGNAALNAIASAGIGTSGSPYIIENYVINASGLGVHGILITNTDAYFILRNCTVTNTDSGYLGIRLENVTNGNITNNYISDIAAHGIYLWRSYNNTLTHNIVNNNTGNGIYLESSDWNTLTNNTAINDYRGLYIKQSSNNTLINNTATNNDEHGIYLRESSNNTLTNNIVNNSTGHGIYLRESSNNTLTNNTFNNNTGNGINLYLSCDNNTLTNNTANDNDANGIYLRESSNNTLTNNTATDNGEHGIYLRQSSNNTLTNNTANDNDANGINLYWSCDDNTLTNNTAIFNTQDGINLNNSNYNKLTGNTANHNTMHGIYLEYSRNNTLTNNTAENDTHGIFLNDDCDNNTLITNIANKNTGNGIYLYWSCDDNTLTHNTATDNDYRGIYLRQSSNNTLTNNTVNNNKGIGIYLRDNCDSNTLINNTATDNGEHGIYLRQSSNNTLTNNIINNSTGHGIYIRQSSNNTLTNNTANNNAGNGIILYWSCDDNTLTNNTANNNIGNGIYLFDRCDWNTLTNNIANDNEGNGIYLYLSCDDNTLTNNTAKNNTFGIRLTESSTRNNLTYNTVIFNTQYGIYLTPTSDYNNISSNYVMRNAPIDIYLENSSYNTITENLVVGNLQGIQEEVGCTGNIIENNIYYLILFDVTNHIENGVSVPPGIVQMTPDKDLNVTLTYRTMIEPNFLTWTNASFFYKINENSWKGPYFLGYGYGLQTSSFIIGKDNYSTFDEIYYYFSFLQYDNNSQLLDKYYWTQDGVKYNEPEARSNAFHKKISSILWKLTLNYSVWYKAQQEAVFPSYAGYNVTMYPWMRIAYENISLSFFNVTSTHTNFSVSCLNESKLAHYIDEASSNISKFDGPQIQVSEGIKSPFVLPLNLTLTNFTSTITIPQISFDSLGSGRNLTFTGILLNLTYMGLENWPYPYRSVLKFEGDNAIIRYDIFTRIMVYFEYSNDTVNASSKIVFGLIGNNQSYPNNLEIEKRAEIADNGTIVIPDYLSEIIYDPPGDHSYSQMKAGTTVSYGTSIETEVGAGRFAEMEFLVFGFGGGVDMSANWREKQGYDVEVDITYEKTLTSSLNSEDPALIGPGRGDLYYGAGLVINYYIIVNNYYIIYNTPDAPNNHLDDIKVWENGSRIQYGLNMSSQFSILGAYLGQYNLTNLTNYNIFADNTISPDEEEFVEIYPDSPMLWTPEYMTELMYSYSNETTVTKTFTFEYSLQTFFSWHQTLDVGFIASKTVFESTGKIGVSFDYSMTRTGTSATQENREIICHLEDDDGTPIGEHDQFVIDIYRDLRYNTFGYIIHDAFTYTSRPYEIGTLDRRSPTTSEIFNLEEYVQGTVVLNCGAVDEETGVDHVKFYYDNDPIFDLDSIQLGYQDNATIADPNVYQFIWDTTTFHGTYYLFAVTYDSAGAPQNFLISDAFIINIDNVLPTVCQARAYEPFRGAIHLYANVFDADSGIENVEYWDGVPSNPSSTLLGISYDSSSSFNFVWATDPNGADDGIHDIYARGYDRAGNYLDSAAIILNVNNQPLPAPPDYTLPITLGLIIAGTSIAAAIIIHGFLRRPLPPPPPPKKTPPTPKKTPSTSK
ncbi:MAG: right-handed parallel beta-helix repeat-containing protein [Candidatus Helarchaeota archaeon]|nr:right-handed parallel beta-helix repeat-containing protein [Candidatus Helarchaeota archaeon]